MERQWLGSARSSDVCCFSMCGQSSCVTHSSESSEPETSESDRRLFTAVLVVPFIVEGVISVAELVAPVERKPVLKEDDADVAARLAQKLA